MKDEPRPGGGVFLEMSMSAFGRQRLLKAAGLMRIERALSGKADVQDIVFEKSLGNDRYTPVSGH